MQGPEAEVARAGAGAGCGGARHQQVLGPDEEAALASAPVGGQDLVVAASFAHRPMSLPPSLPLASRSLGSLAPSPAFRPLTPSPLDRRTFNTAAVAAS